MFSWKTVTMVPYVGYAKWPVQPAVQHTTWEDFMPPHHWSLLTVQFGKAPKRPLYWALQQHLNIWEGSTAYVSSWIVARIFTSSCTAWYLPSTKAFSSSVCHHLVELHIIHAYSSLTIEIKCCEPFSTHFTLCTVSWNSLSSSVPKNKLLCSVGAFSAHFKKFLSVPFCELVK